MDIDPVTIGIIDAEIRKQRAQAQDTPQYSEVADEREARIIRIQTVIIVIVIFIVMMGPMCLLLTPWSR